MPQQRKACDTCHKRKIQCILLKDTPRCEWCTHRDTPCTFDRVRGKKKARRRPEEKGVAQETEIAARIKAIEEATARIQARNVARERKPATASPTSSSSASSLRDIHHDSAISVTPGDGGTPYNRPNTGQIYFGALQLGSIDPKTGLPYISTIGQQWIYESTGQWPSFTSLDVGFKQGNSCAAKLLAKPGSHCNEMPAEATIRAMMQRFIDLDLRLILPVVDPTLFEETLLLAYDPDHETAPDDKLAARGCVLAFFCFMYLHSGDFYRGPPIDVDECVAEVHSLVFCSLESPSLTVLQTMAMLLFYYVGSGRFRIASMLHAIASRMLFDLGGHTVVIDVLPQDRALTMAEREDRQLRWMFWLCYLFDKDIAIRTGQPHLLHDDFCDLTLPPDYMKHRASRDTNRHDPRVTADAINPENPWFPGDLKLTILKSKTWRLLYSANAMKKSDAELLRCIRELDEDLENWRISIPETFIPSLHISKPSILPPTASIHNHMHHLELHLEYHHLMSVIHHAIGRCESLKNPDGAGQVTMGTIESSLELSVEASRSTLIYLSAAINGLAKGAAWILVFYPISALMILFFNILRDPLHEQAAADLKLIVLTQVIIRDIGENKVRAQDSSNFKRLGLLIAELGRLGQHAIDKAKAQ